MPKNVNLKKRGIYILPNLFTLTAMFAGFYAVVAAMKGLYINAAIAIYLAMLMDSLDGRIARMTNTQTAFGAELDSLSDMVSFGVAPALVTYSWALHNLGKFGWLSAFVYAVAVALRLARFNVQIGKIDQRYFQGLPCPPSAGVIAGMVWTCTNFGLSGWTMNIVTAIVTICLGILMVSNIRYQSFKKLNLKRSVRFLTIVLIVLLLILVAVDPSRILFAVFLLYALSGPIMTFWQLRKKRKMKKKINLVSSGKP
jgi:CDP-diacylglycerol--serine O-phosphatidyltransferase